MTKYDHCYSIPFTILLKNKQYLQFLYPQNAYYQVFKFGIYFHLGHIEKTLLLHYPHLRYIEQVLPAFYLLLETLYKILPDVLLNYDILYHEQLDSNQIIINTFLTLHTQLEIFP